MRKLSKSQDAPTSERERLLFEANHILVSRAANPNSLDWVAKGTEPWRSGEEYRIIQLVQGGWNEGFQCLEDVDDFLAGPGYRELIARNEVVKEEFKRFLVEKNDSKRRRLPRSTETIYSTTRLLEYRSRVEKLDAMEVDEAIRLNNELLAAGCLESAAFKTKCRRNDVRFAWKQRQLKKAALATIKYFTAEYRLFREYVRAWSFNWSCSGPYPNCESKHDCEVHK
jgi:hypothetical protein